MLASRTARTSPGPARGGSAAGRLRSLQARLPRRVRSQDEHDAPEGPLTPGRAAGGQQPPWALEDHHHDLLDPPGRIDRLHDDRRATDTEVFQAYVREVLCPSLKPGDVVIMDNLGPHKNAQTSHSSALPTPRPLPAGLLPGPKPHRDDVEQGEGLPAQGRGQISPRSHQRHHPGPPRDHTQDAATGLPTAATVLFKML